METQHSEPSLGMQLSSQYLWSVAQLAGFSVLLGHTAMCDMLVKWVKCVCCADFETLLILCK
jgi:hypothetical protein